MGLYQGLDLFPTDIYQFDETDVVQGGPNGIDNVPLKQLADRTTWLFNRTGRIAEKEVSASGALDKTNANTLINVVAGVGTITQTLGNLSDYQPGAVVYFAAHCAFGANVKLAATGASFWDYEGHKSELYLHNKEFIALLSTATHWKILQASPGIYQAGEELKARRRLNNTLVLDGSLVSRASYPRLWAFVQTLTMGQEVVSESTWLSDPYRYRSCFTTGTTGANFRLPDERGMFERMLDLGRGVSFGRTHNYAGGYEADMFKEHDHEFAVAVTPGGGSAGGRSNTTGPNGKTTKAGGEETRSKNIGKLHLIKY
ncbi:hypothetical protein [Foetidibacter luteolus]|uniref:hypothetical protein n=1 Tax=Foetidibacter luteolus TaxID=2608880 RepID=UPI00129A35AF|nr:hypothetical protein [Foetidibacter luteolus]